MACERCELLEDQIETLKELVEALKERSVSGGPAVFKQLENDPEPDADEKKELVSKLQSGYERLHSRASCVIKNKDGEEQSAEA